MFTKSKSDLDTRIIPNVIVVTRIQVKNNNDNIFLKTRFQTILRMKCPPINCTCAYTLKTIRVKGILFIITIKLNTHSFCTYILYTYIIHLYIVFDECEQPNARSLETFPAQLNARASYCLIGIRESESFFSFSS